MSSSSRSSGQSNLSPLLKRLEHLSWRSVLGFYLAITLRCKNLRAAERHRRIYCCDHRVCGTEVGQPAADSVAQEGAKIQPSVSASYMSVIGKFSVNRIENGVVDIDT